MFLLNTISKKDSEDNSRKSRFRVLLLVCTLIIALVWVSFSVFSSGNIRFDSERMTYDRDGVITQYRSEGRIILAFLLQYLFPAVWNPVLYGIIFLLFFLASGAVLTYFLARFTSFRWPALLYALFFLLYGTSPVWAFQVYFTLQSPVVAFGMLVAVFLAISDVRIRTEKTSLSLRILLECTALIGCSVLMLIYQSLIIYYLTAAAMLLFCRLLEGIAPSWKSVILWALRIVLSLIIYIFIAKSVRSGDSDYLMYQIQWRRLSVFTCLKDIVIEFGKILFMSHSGHFSLYLPGLIMVVILLVRKLRGQTVQKNVAAMLILTSAALLLLPMAISIMEGSRPVPRTQFALQIVAAFLPLCFLAESGKLSRIVLAIACFIVVLQSVLVFRLIYTDNRRNDFDLEAASRISEDLSSAGAQDQPLVFIGSLGFPDESLFLEKTDVFGLSFFEWSVQPDQPTSATNGSIRMLNATTKTFHSYPDASMVSEAVQLANDMPAYPNEGYCRSTGSFCIIKLSD